MIGTLVQNFLYVLLAVTVILAVAGAMITRQARKDLTQDYGNLLTPVVAGLSLIAASAPYIGLFGTVWHIIQALGGIGSGNLNVAAIAKPIGEALYATLWGLGCAIPALVAHKTILTLLPGDAPAAARPEEA